MAREVKRNPLLSSYNNYQFTHIGGENSYTDSAPDYIQRQKEIIDKQNKKVPKSYIPPYDDMRTVPFGLDVYSNFNNGRGGGRHFNENTETIIEKERTRFDPYADFLYKNGLIDRDNEVRYDTWYLNINSSLRNKTPTVSREDPIKLLKNPLKFIEYSTDGIYTITQLRITHKGHQFKVNDSIELFGIPNNYLILRTIDDLGNSPFLLKTGDEYLTIRFPKVSGIDILYYSAENKDDLYINLSGFRGISVLKPYIGNIPINDLNRAHKVYFTTKHNPIFNPDVIYVKLSNSFDTMNHLDPIYVFPSSYNVTITYQYSEGVPNNLINSLYPINVDHKQGYLVITSVDDNHFFVTMLHRAGSNKSFGGYEVYIAKIIEIEEGFVNSNKYQYDLGKAYANVVYATIVSTEFPNSHNNVNQTNNKFYWENLDESNHIYEIEFPFGYYSTEQLEHKFEDLVKKVKRIDTLPGYTDLNLIDLEIESNTDNVIFRSYREAILKKPFIDTIPDIPLVRSEEDDDPDSVQIQIKHFNHKLKVDDEIRIEGALDYYGIDGCYLNRCHKITAVINENVYIITINNLNLLERRYDSKGGNNVRILVPNRFRIRNDYKDNICQLLGFKDVGEKS
jgi:hypothetical protein